MGPSWVPVMQLDVVWHHPQEAAEAQELQEVKEAHNGCCCASTREKMKARRHTTSFTTYINSGRDIKTILIDNTHRQMKDFLPLFFAHYRT